MRSFEGLTFNLPPCPKGNGQLKFCLYLLQKKDACQIGTKVQIRNFGQSKSCNSSQKNTCSPVDTRRCFNIYKTSIRHRRRRIDVLQTLKRRRVSTGLQVTNLCYHYIITQTNACAMLITKEVETVVNRFEINT